MRNLLIATFIALILSACADEKKQEKDLLDDLLKVHDKVMGNDDALMKNKMLEEPKVQIPKWVDIGRGE